MTVAQFASTNLHDPVLLLVRPVPVALRCSQTIADAHAAIRAAPKARHVPYFYVLDDEDRLAGADRELARETYDEIYQLLGVDATAMRTP